MKDVFLVVEYSKFSKNSELQLPTFIFPRHVLEIIF